MVSREQKGNIEFTIKFRASEEEPLITYEISIGLDEHARAVVKKEVLRFRRGQKGCSLESTGLLLWGRNRSRGETQLL